MKLYWLMDVARGQYRAFYFAQFVSGMTDSLITVSALLSGGPSQARLLPTTADQQPTSHQPRSGNTLTLVLHTQPLLCSVLVTYNYRGISINSTMAAIHTIVRFTYKSSSSL